MKEKVEHKIDLIEDADATGELAKVYDEWRAHSGRQQMPGILKCFSYRPDFLRQVMAFSNGVHFSQGHLDRKTKEAIASYVSYLNVALIDWTRMLTSCVFRGPETNWWRRLWRASLTMPDYRQKNACCLTM